ncbi:MAG: MFS transporter [Rhizobium sp.]|nr:MAG: MFS transporter [Rhizobium sp.]
MAGSGRRRYTLVGEPLSRTARLPRPTAAPCLLHQQKGRPHRAVFPHVTSTIRSLLGVAFDGLLLRSGFFAFGSVAHFRETSRGHIMGLDSGLLKMIFSLKTRRLLGVHIVGEGATELVHIGQAVLNLKGTVEYFVENTFNYPTLASLKPAVRIPAKALAAVLMTTPVNVAGWALAGFYLSLMPSLVSVATGIRSPLIGASVVSMLMLVASLSVMTLRGLAASRIMVIGTLSLMIGVAVTLTGIHLQNVVLLFAGTAVVGIGFGANFSAILRIVLPLADADDRAALLSAFFVESYLAFSLPAIVAGLTAPYLGLAGTSYAYGGGVLLLAAISLVATRRLPVHR